MIFFSDDLGVMISDIYGEEGSTELRALAKKMRLNRDHLRQEGHPAEEHYLVPVAKHATISERGVKVLFLEEFRTIQVQKALRLRANTMLEPVQPSTVSPSQDEVTDFYNQYDRRQQDRGRRRRHMGGA